MFNWKQIFHNTKQLACLATRLQRVVFLFIFHSNFFCVTRKSNFVTIGVKELDRLFLLSVYRVMKLLLSKSLSWYHQESAQFWPFAPVHDCQAERQMKRSKWFEVFATLVFDETDVTFSITVFDKCKNDEKIMNMLVRVCISSFTNKTTYYSWNSWQTKIFIHYKSWNDNTTYSPLSIQNTFLTEAPDWCHS